MNATAEPTAAAKAKGAAEPKTACPAWLDGALEHIGGSMSDAGNDRLAAEIVEAIPGLACETRDQKMAAALHGLAGIAPRDELEAMMAAQLIAAHAAVMDCYRRAANEDSFERRREYLNQAVRLSRAFVALLAALQRRRERALKAALSADRARTAKSAKQPSRAPAPASAQSAKQPQAPLLAPDLPDPPAQAERAAAMTPNAESPKQPSAAAGPAIVRPQPGAAEGTAAVLPFVRSEPGELIKFAKQPWPIAPARRSQPLALTCRTPGVHRAALIAQLMEGTGLRIAE